MSLLSRSLCCFGIVLSVLMANAVWPADSGADGIGDELRQELCLPLGRLELVTIATSKDEHYSEEAAARNAPDIVKFEACHVGQQRLLFKITFARKPVFDGAGVILYADLDANRQTGRQPSYPAAATTWPNIWPRPTTPRNTPYAVRKSRLSDSAPTLVAAGRLDGDALGRTQAPRPHGQARRVRHNQGLWSDRSDRERRRYQHRQRTRIPGPTVITIPPGVAIH